MQTIPQHGRRASDSPAEAYARQTRNATVFIAWVVGIFFAGALIMGIIAGVQLAKISSELNTGSVASTSNCVPGSAVPGCP